MIVPADMSLPPVALCTLSPDAAWIARMRSSPPAPRSWFSVPTAGWLDPTTGDAIGDAAGEATCAATLFCAIAAALPRLTPSAVARWMKVRRSICPFVKARCRSRNGLRLETGTRMVKDSFARIALGLPPGIPLFVCQTRCSAL